jgi:hypothetical protein
LADDGSSAICRKSAQSAVIQLSNSGGARGLVIMFMGNLKADLLPALSIIRNSSQPATSPYIPSKNKKSQDRKSQNMNNNQGVCG